MLRFILCKFLIACNFSLTNYPHPKKGGFPPPKKGGFPHPRKGAFHHLTSTGWKAHMGEFNCHALENNWLVMGWVMLYPRHNCHTQDTTYPKHKLSTPQKGAFHHLTQQHPQAGKSSCCSLTVMPWTTIDQLSLSL